MKTTKRFILVNLFILFTLIILPISVMATMPTTTSFDRHNIYSEDGYRGGGYYAVRSNLTYNGTMNMTHVGGSNTFIIETYNINNMTLDFDLMYERRSYLFGWDEVTWDEAVDYLGNDIYINISTDGTLESLRFVDQPNVWVKVWKNDTVYRGWMLLSDVEIDSEGFEAGDYIIRIQFQDSMTIYDILSLVLQVMVIVGIFLLIYSSIKRIFYYDEGDYYMRVWK